MDANVKKSDLPDFIPGIYNYCDRWCERCNRQQQCISFVMEKKVEEKACLNELKEGENEWWGHMEHVFESTHELLREVAEERGMQVDEICLSEQADAQFAQNVFEHVEQEEAIYMQLESCDILKMCKTYEYWGGCCIDHFSPYMEQEAYEHAEEIEIVTWYLDLIQLKMRRALYSKAILDAGGRLGEEYEGSVKVALLAIDDSLVAWRKMKDFYPDYSREIMHLEVMLHQIQVDIEQEFPTARQFVRPGLDE